MIAMRTDDFVNKPMEQQIKCERGNAVMKKFVFLGLTAVLLSFFISAGCQRKVTKVERPLEMAKPVPPPVTPEVEIEEVEVTEPAEPMPKPKELLSLRDINFDFDKYELRPDAREILAEHARLITKNLQAKILIEGHCDERGTIEYNLALGEKRAFACKNYLVNYGINPNRLSTISYGKERPLDPRHSDEAWAKNRRATFIITEGH